MLSACGLVADTETARATLAPMSIHLPTLLLLSILLSLTLSLSLAWVSRRGVDDGLRLLAGAFAVQALSLVLLLLRGRLPDAVTMVSANVGIASAYSLFLLAVFRFRRLRLPPGWLWGPPLIVLAGFLYFIDNMPMRVLVLHLTLLACDFRILQALKGVVRQDGARGVHLLMAGVALHMLSLLVRTTYVFDGTFLLPHLHGDALVDNGVGYLISLVALMLVWLGFVLMSKEAAEDGMRRAAMFDGLTGCNNRSRIEALARQEVARLGRYGTPLSVILIDLDNFKGVNDRHGHLAGDAVLKGFVARCQACIRSTDHLGRWGGEEFLILMPGTGLPAAAAMAERIRAAIEAEPLFGNISLTISAGFAACRPSDDWADCLGRADLALYRAKSDGRNRVESELPFDPSEDGTLPRAPLLALRWRDDYRCGSAEIDEQHQHLFAGANRLLALIAEDDGTELLGREIRRFIAEAQHHMNAEELELAAAGFAGLDAHAGQHAHLIETAHGLLERYERGVLEAGELVRFLIHDFTIRHLLTEDRQYHQSLGTHLTRAGGAGQGAGGRAPV